MHIYIGNKTYSSWSMRPWLVLKAFDIPFDETVIRLEEPDFKERVMRISPAGKVPVLVDGDRMVWETLSIIEYLAEKYPEREIWPGEASARAHARSVASEMHAGFGALRSACSMNLGRRFGKRDRGSDVEADVQRIESLWREALMWFSRTGDGPFLYGAFTAADAMYAPVVSRLDGYGFEVAAVTRSYMDAVQSHPAYVAWREAALAEPWVIPEDEADEPAIENFKD